MRSEPEWSASETIAIEPDMNPTTSLKAMRTEFETMETVAARDLRRWSRTSACGSWSGLAVASTLWRVLLSSIEQPLPSQTFEEGRPGQRAVTGLVLLLLRPLGHSEV